MAFVGQSFSVGQVLTAAQMNQVEDNIDAAMGILGSEVATTSGTSVTLITGVPSWVKQIDLYGQSVSLDAGTSLLLQMGDSGGFETASYNSQLAMIPNGGFPTVYGTSTSSAGFILGETAAGSAISFHCTLSLKDASDNTWMMRNNGGVDSAASAHSGAGIKVLSDVLTQIRITTVSGTANFDGGSVAVRYS